MTDILAPLEQEGTKAVVRAWMKRIGERVEEGEPLVELETDKVTQEVPAPAAGVLLEVLLDSDAEARPGAVLGRIGAGEAGTGTGPAEPVPTLAQSAAPAELERGELRLSPAVRKALREHDVAPEAIEGTGRDGRITRADVEETARRRDEGASVPAEPPAAPVPSAPAAPSEPGAHSVPHGRMRLAIARNMAQSVREAPHVTAVFEADFTAILAHRARHRDAFAAEGAALTLTAYFVAASVAAMRAVPSINARWHEDRLEIFSDVNVGVGTALGEEGLVVPVIHRAQELSLTGIARRLGETTRRARAGRLEPADMRGGTFTLSNHGVSGSLLAAPVIIPQPQSAILGIGKLEKRVVVREIGGQDAILVRPMAYVSLTIDHRAVDGFQTNRWLSRFVEVLESWPLDD